MADKFLKLLEDFVFHVITEFTGIEIGTMSLWTGFKLNQEGFFLKHVAHFHFTFWTGHIEDFVESCTDEIISDIDRFRTL